MSARRPLHLFEACGVELEYMIVDAESLDVRPVADALIEKAVGRVESEIERGDIAWSNELALHVLELKTNGPAPHLAGLEQSFQREVRGARELLADLGATLLPTGMHPWMDPQRELRLWPHEYGPVYAAYDRIFGCRGHGWANLQSAHLNLPFADDDEFGRLHAAVRVLLPLLPALAASSPLVEGAPAACLDQRLEVYRDNARQVASVSGLVIPERVWTRADYERLVLGRIYADLEPLDPDGVLRHEWVNARGCIARFDRMAVEIRLLDVQECPLADLAIAAAATAALRALADGELADPARQRGFDGAELGVLLLDTIRDGDAARVSDPGYLELLDFPGRGPCSAGELWAHLIERTLARTPETDRWRPALDAILREGCLARRILRRLGGDHRREHLRAVYAELAKCLGDGSLFRAA